jgi:hypothetical protein
VNRPTDWIVDGEWREIASKSVRNNQGDYVNADSLLQPGGILRSELIATEHVFHGGILCRQSDYSLGQRARPVGG